MKDWRNRDWVWTVGILITIIVFLLSYKLWGKSGNLIDFISIGSGISSITLAVAAIIISIRESNSSHDTLKVITGNLRQTENLINNLGKDNIKTHNELSKIHDYVNNINGFKLNSNEEEIKIAKEQKEDSTKKDNKIQEVETSIKDDKTDKQPHSSQFVVRGDIYFADLSPVVGSEQGGIRPVVVLQNDIGNRFSPTITIAPVTAQIKKSKLPTHVDIDAIKYGFERDSVILIEQIKTIDKQRLMEKVTQLQEPEISKLKKSIEIQLGLRGF